MIQLLRGTQQQLNSYSTIIPDGQPVFEKDTGQLKIGNGASMYSALPYVGASGSSEYPKINRCWGSTNAVYSCIEVSEGLTLYNYSVGLNENSSEWVHSSRYGLYYIQYDISDDLQSFVNQIGVPLKPKCLFSYAQYEATGTATVTSFVQGCDVYVSNGAIRGTLRLVWLSESKTPPVALSRNAHVIFMLGDA